MQGMVIHPKRRQGARGVPKVRTGCKTCKIRHKKCDEARPACSPCVSTGRRCDFSTSSHRHPSQPAPLVFIVESMATPSPLISPVYGNPIREELLSAQLGVPGHLRHLDRNEAIIFDYFLSICAQEFSLYFQSPIWERFVLYAVHAEAWAFHAALAISVLSRRSYAPSHNNTTLQVDFPTLHYNQAIRALNQRLDTTAESAELAVLGSVLFINLEFLRAHTLEHEPSRVNGPSLVGIHLHGGLAVLRNLGDIRGGHLSLNAQHLKVALEELHYQVEQFKVYRQQ
ncbi:hypothetical protein NW759_013339 [Fusarium solani]|nr:hypothetical protein NW759_013339 [Fusarium solani]